MGIERYIEQNFPVECKGRGNNGKSVLREAVQINVKFYKKQGSNIISSDVECPYNSGSHGQRCIASHQEKNSGMKINCHYSIDIPYALDSM